MMHESEHFKYSEQHLWVKIEGDCATIGLTSFVQSALGEIVFVELPQVGVHYSLGKPFGSVESIKTVTELYVPVSGVVTEVNESLHQSTEPINRSPDQEGWLIKVQLSNVAELNHLWSWEKYRNTYL
jgi:glycine cleavage system H protein